MPERMERLEERWRTLWATSPQRSPFSRLEHVRSAAEAAGLRLDVHFVEENGKDLAGAAVTWRRRGPYKEVVVPPFAPLSALILEELPDEATVHSGSSPFARILRTLEESYDAVHLHLHPSLTDVRTASWRDWEAHPLYTYVVPLSEGVDPESRWSSSTVRNFRSSRADFELVRGEEAVAGAVELAVGSYERSGRSAPLASEALLTHVLGRLREGTADAYLLRKTVTDREHAGVVLLRDAGRAYYWIAGSLPGAGMTVLLGEILGLLKPPDVTSFDFVGANTASIAEFKRRFGSQLETYYRIVYYRRKDLQLLYALRKIFR